MIIGICGKSGSGKSTLGRQLLELINNSVYLEMDKVGHYVLQVESAKEEIINTLGPSILTENDIDRKKVGNIIFSSKELYKKYCEIVWGYIKVLTDEFIENNKDKVIILDGIALHETEYFNMCDIKILLDIPYEIRKERAIKRDNITEEKFDLREKANINYNLEDFDLILKTNDYEMVKRLVKKI